MWHANTQDLARYATDHWGDTRLNELSRVSDCGPEASLPDQNTLSIFSHVASKRVL